MSAYLYASVVRLTMDDPCNENLNKGDVILVAGRHEEEYSYTVIDDEKRGFTDVTCESLGSVKADGWMNEDEIKTWAQSQEEAVELAEEAEA